MGDAIGLVIDGAVVPGESGTYPVTNPVRPAEVVFEAPSASPAQLDRAVAAARAAFPAWSAMAPEERAEVVAKAAAAAGAAVEALDLATPPHPRARQGAVGGAVRLGHHRRHGGRLRAARRRGPGRADHDRRRRARGTRGARALRRGGRPAAVQLAGVGVRQQGAARPPRRQHGGGQSSAHVPGSGAGRGRRHGRGPPPRSPERHQRARLRAGRDARVASRRGHGVVHRRRAHGPGRDGRRFERGSSCRSRARRERRRHRGARHRHRRRAGGPHRRCGLHHYRPGVHGHQAAVRARGQGPVHGGRPGGAGGERGGG